MAKLSPDGSSLAYSTYFGGTLQGATTAIAIDSNNEATVTGWTYATDFPVQNAFQMNHASDGGTYDAFVSKFSASGSSLIFSTYLGGNLADLGQGIAIDSSGNIYVTGTTNSSDFPTTSGSYQSTYVSNPAGSSFVSKFAPSGQSLTYSTYLPASQAFAIAVNATGNAYVTGFTGESGFPTTSGAFQTVEGGGFSSDAFVAEFDNSGSSLVYSTYLGGNNEDYGYAIALDAAGDAFVTGTTSSPNFPLAVPIQAAGYSGVPSVFISGLNNSRIKSRFFDVLGRWLGRLRKPARERDCC